jgi:uncharacterized protein YndB with AHSA1/START domain
MIDKSLEIKTTIQILKPSNEVFEAIVEPEKMSNYFISQGSGKMEENEKIEWTFPEFTESFPIRVGKIEKNKYVSYYWEINGKEHLVEITLQPKDADATIVTVTEKAIDDHDPGIQWLKGNTEGWANFLACLKAYLEYGINLRKGAFDFLKK